MGAVEIALLVFIGLNAAVAVSSFFGPRKR